MLSNIILYCCKTFRGLIIIPFVKTLNNNLNVHLYYVHYGSPLNFFLSDTEFF